MSLFPEGTLEVDNPQSREEDEELEEQRRRQEELTDLLAAGIHAFNYDESTINSSATSFEEQTYNDRLNGKDDTKTKGLSNMSANLLDAAAQDYRDAAQQDQLKVLYEVRMREINNLRKEFAEYKEEKAKEISVLKNKVTLSEAEIRHLQLSLTNSESLLVEKTELIRNLKQNVSSKDQEIVNLKRVIDDLKLEVCTYSSTISKLQLKLSDNNPFSAGARKFKSEELQKAHQDQIIKLETLLQEQSKKTQILEKENVRLEEDLKKIMKSKTEIEEENNFTIMSLSKKLQSSQQQCRDLYLLGEAIKKESDHFKERIQQMEVNKLDLSGDGFKIKKADKETLVVHMEKLKRMLLDKDVEMNTLKTKLKFYESDMDELFEYRKLFNEMYSCEVKPCSNAEHEELLIFMQRQLQSDQQAIEDRNNQILNLNMVNKELREKIEDMIQQTRTDIQNLSQKYSLPQLETMSNELKNAEKTIHDLKKQLLEQNETDKLTLQELTSKLEKALKHNEYLQQMAVTEKQNFEDILNALQNDLKRAEEDKMKFQELIEDCKNSELKLTEENARVKSVLEKISAKLGVSQTDLLKSEDVHELNALRSKYGHVHDQLQQVAMHLEKMSPKKAIYRDENVTVILKLKKQILNYINVLKNHNFEKAEIEEKLKHWGDILTHVIDGLKKSDSLAEMATKESELRDSIEDLTNSKTMLEGEKFTLEYQLKICTNELENARKEIKDLIENKNNLMRESEDNSRVIHKLQDQVIHLEKCLKIVEENKTEIENQLENTQRQLNEANQEIIKLQGEFGKENENTVRQNLFKELKEVESVLGQNITEGGSPETYQKLIQAEILKAELLLRERLEEESIKKMDKIEERYKNVLTQKTEMYNKEKEKWKNQEVKYRKHFAAVLEECGKKMDELEKENADLIRQINGIIKEYKTYQINSSSDSEQYKKIIADYKKNMEAINKKWQDIFGYYVLNFMKIEKQGQKKRTKLQKTMSMNQTELNLIASMYDEKITKIKSEWKATSRR